MGFGIILIGFIFILFDLKFNMINVLPNIVGWILVLIGVYTILRHIQNTSFEQAKKIAYIIVGVSALEWITRTVPIFSTTLANADTVLGRAYLACQQMALVGAMIYFMYEFCRGIEVEARHLENEDLVVKSKKMFKVYAAFTGFMSLITLVILLFMGQSEVQFNLGAAGMILFILFAIVLLYVAYELFSLLNQSRRFFVSTKSV